MPREGWLPQDTEGLWAALLSEDTARVQNVPLLQEGVAEGDVVRFTTDTEGRHLGVGRRQQDRADLDGRQRERLVDGGAQNLWVFDKDSLQYLGLNWETTSDSRIGPKGTVISEESVLQQAYVDQVGVRPAQ